MKIHEVRFRETPQSKVQKSRYFSNHQDQKDFIISHIGLLFDFEYKSHDVGRNKSDIIKFLNKENGDE